MKNPKKDVMKVVELEENERLTKLLKEAKNFPGNKEAQVKELEQNIYMSSKEDFVTDLDVAEALVKIVSESKDTPVISKILSKLNHSELRSKFFWIVSGKKNWITRVSMHSSKKQFYVEGWAGELSS